MLHHHNIKNPLSSTSFWEKLTKSERILLRLCLDCCHMFENTSGKTKGKLYIGRKKLSEKAGCSEATVKRAMRKFRELGLCSYEGQKHSKLVETQWGNWQVYFAPFLFKKGLTPYIPKGIKKDNNNTIKVTLCFNPQTYYEPSSKTSISQFLKKITNKDHSIEKMILREFQYYFIRKKITNISKPEWHYKLFRFAIQTMKLMKKWGKRFKSWSTRILHSKPIQVNKYFPTGAAFQFLNKRAYSWDMIENVVAEFRSFCTNKEIKNKLQHELNYMFFPFVKWVCKLRRNYDGRYIPFFKRIDFHNKKKTTMKKISPKSPPLLKKSSMCLETLKEKLAHIKYEVAIPKVDKDVTFEDFENLVSNLETPN